MVAKNYTQLTEAVKADIIRTYQHNSLLGLFPSVPIEGGIATEKWVLKILSETKRAAVHERGWKPNQIKLALKNFEITPCTIDQEMHLDEIEREQYDRGGLSDVIKIETLGENMAYTANRWLMMHKPGNPDEETMGEAASEFHYILAGGAANGTLERPNWVYDSDTGGTWSSAAAMLTDLATLFGEFKAKLGGDTARVLLAPYAAAPTLEKVFSEYQNKTPDAYIREIYQTPMLYVEDEFFYTAADDLPTKSLFDLVLIDPTEFIIGYERPERIRSWEHPNGRQTNFEAEMWFAPLCMPFRKRVGTTTHIFKSGARIKAINV